MQTLIVNLLLLLAGLYVLWYLLPAGLWKRWFGRLAKPRSGCHDCGQCDKSQGATGACGAADKPVHWQPPR
jgi:hypothetical protein